MIIEELINRIFFEVRGQRAFNQAAESMDRMEDAAEDAAEEVQDLERRLDRAERAGRAFGRGIRRVAGGLRNLASGALSRAGQVLGVSSIGFAGLGAAALKSASDTQEAQSKLQDILGDNSRLIENWAKRNAASFNASTNELRQFATDFTVQFKTIADDVEASDFARTLTERALDLASFSNKSATDVVGDFTSALNGSSETVEKYGLNLKQSAIENFILQNGIRRTKKEITEADKRLARYNLILQGTQDAAGNAARTSGDFANVLRNLRGRFVDLLSNVGERLIPLATEALKAFTDLIVRNSDAIVKFFGDGAERIEEFIRNGGLEKIIGFLKEVIGLAGQAGRALGAIVDPFITTEQERQQSIDRSNRRQSTGFERTARAAGIVQLDPNAIADAIIRRSQRRQFDRTEEGQRLASIRRARRNTVLLSAVTRSPGIGQQFAQTVNVNINGDVNNPNTVARAARQGAAQGARGATNVRAGSGKGA